MLLFTIAGGVTTGCITLALSQAIDVIDLDELHTGEKRAGALRLSREDVVRVQAALDAR